MGNSTTLVTKKQWNCSLKTSVHPMIRKEYTTSSSFSIKGLPNPSFTISACFINPNTLLVKLQLLKSDSKREWKAALAEIVLDVYGIVERQMEERKKRRIFNLSKKSGLVEWEQERLFRFDKFPNQSASLPFAIYIEYIRCKITWHGPILTMPAVEISMYDMKPFLISAEFSDVTLIIDNEELPAHKIVLASQSPVFGAMFTTPMRESLENTVHIQDTNIHTVRIILKYLYTGHCTNLNDPGVLWEIFNFARMYEMSQLKSICERKLIENLTIEDVVNLLDILDDNARMLYDVMLEHNFIFGKKAPEYPIEFSLLMKQVFINRKHIKCDDIDIIKTALTFWYSGKSKELSKTDVLWKMYVIMKKHNITECRDFCERELLNSLNFENVVNMLDAADDCQSKTVYWRALHIAAERRGEMSNRDDFRELCLRKTKLAVEFLEYCGSQKIPQKKNNKEKASSRGLNKPTGGFCNSCILNI